MSRNNWIVRDRGRALFATLLDNDVVIQKRAVPSGINRRKCFVVFEKRGILYLCTVIKNRNEEEGVYVDSWVVIESDTGGVLELEPSMETLHEVEEIAKIHFN